MRGISPGGSVTRGRPRSAAIRATVPPAVSVTTVTWRASAVSSAESTSAVSPEYDDTTTSAPGAAVAGKP